MTERHRQTRTETQTETGTETRTETGTETRRSIGAGSSQTCAFMPRIRSIGAGSSQTCAFMPRILFRTLCRSPKISVEKFPRLICQRVLQKQGTKFT